MFGRIGLRFWLKFGIWALLFFVFVRLEFGIVYCIVSAIYLIFANTRTRKAGEMVPTCLLGGVFSRLF